MVAWICFVTMLAILLAVAVISVGRFEEARNASTGEETAALHTTGSEFAPVLHVRCLKHEERTGFHSVWHSVREQFTSQPEKAIAHADILLSDLIADLTDDAGGSPQGVRTTVDLGEGYRTARDIAARSRTGIVGTEEMELAMILYAGMFDNLLG